MSVNWGVDGRKMECHHWSNVLNICGINPKGGEAGWDSRVRSTWKSGYAKENSTGREGDGVRVRTREREREMKVEWGGE